MSIARVRYLVIGAVGELVLYASKESYGYDHMIKQDKLAFDDWYKTVASKTFKEQMYLDCKCEVANLRRRCLELRKLLFVQIAGCHVCAICLCCMNMVKNKVGLYNCCPDRYSLITHITSLFVLTLYAKFIVFCNLY